MRSKIGCISGKLKYNLVFYSICTIFVAVVTTNHVMRWRSIVDEMEGPKYME